MMTIWNYLKQNKVLAAILGVTLLGIVLYANTLNNQMFWDDNDFILNNQYVHNLKNIPQYFSEKYWGTYFQSWTYWLLRIKSLSSQNIWLLSVLA